MAVDVDPEPDAVALQGAVSSAVEVRSAVGRTRCRAAVPNAELIAACRRGEGGAWTEMVDRYERLVYAIPLREGLSAADAAEISQSTFEALIESLDRIQEPERLGHWLMTVARRLTWRRCDVARNEVGLDVVPTQRTAGDEMVDLVRTVDVYDAVAQLAEPCRSLIFGLFLDPEEPSYRQISESMDLAVGSIGPMRTRCLERLRDRLRS